MGPAQSSPLSLTGALIKYLAAPLLLNLVGVSHWGVLPRLPQLSIPPTNQSYRPYAAEEREDLFMLW